MVIRSLTAYACLAAPGSELDEARLRAHDGDQDWQEWIDEYERGEATLIDMRVEVTLELADGSVEVVGADDKQVWMHLAQHPPVVAAVVAEMSAKDLGLLARRIRALGEDISPSQLDDMHVDVELADDLLEALRPGHEVRPGRVPAGRPGTVTEPR